MAKEFKEREKRLTLPGLFFDSERFVPASMYPHFRVYTDVCLADLLGVSPMRVSMWRKAGQIPYEQMGNFAAYDLNKVLQALKRIGYEQDKTLKSTKI